MLTDEVTLRLEAGKGGKGAVAFNKVRLAFGPTGGDGGRGGSVFLEGVRDIGALAAYASKKTLSADDGGNGRGQFVDGKDGKDLVLLVPLGTVSTNIETGFAQEITKEGQRILIAGGGLGGRGNFKFRSPTNTTPKQSEPGTAGDAVNVRLQLRLIADVGFIGLPNAGKSSLLNELTGAKSKVGNYAFTTLEPHLGSYYGLIIADIPGLIEGASEGKGLGVKFLKHIERTNSLFHLVSAESDDPGRDYRVVRNELHRYNPVLADKPERVLLTKTDAVEPGAVRAALASLKRMGVEALPVSVLDATSMEHLRGLLNELKSGGKQ